jgi:preprotein translocase SecF subunit
MFRLFHDNNIDFLGRKAVFMTVSVLLMVAGCIAVVARGFNLGVDFAGGTLVYVRFVQAPPYDEIRDALKAEGVDSSKVIIQPISGGGSGTSDGVLIRLPQEERALEVGDQKRSILRALGVFNASATGAPGKINLNAADESDIAAELRRAAQPGLDTEQAAAKVIAHRNAMPNGIYRNIEEVRQTPELAPEAVNLLTSKFYAGKVDLNSIGGDDLLSTLLRNDPLGLGGDAAAARQQYTVFRDAFIQFRDKTRGGVIGSIEEIPIEGFAPELPERLREYFFVGSFNVVNAEAVGAQVGDDLRNRAIYVTLASLVGMLVFIAFRFEWIYGVSAVLAVFHDVPITLGFFALCQWEVNLTVVAALLTLIGYSVNDTIVIFDRIRENLRQNRRDPIELITNDAINQTLSRTVISSGTAFLTVLVLVLFGGDVLRSFAMVLLVGIIVGTYSSIGIASPIMIWWHRRQRAGRGLKAATKSIQEPATRAVRTAKTV